MSNHIDYKLTLDADGRQHVGHVRLNKHAKDLFEQQKVNGSFAVIAPVYKTIINTDGSHIYQLSGLELVPAEQIPQVDPA